MEGDLRHTQMAEQLVEVPTILSPSLLQQQAAELIVDYPVPRGREGSGGEGLQGFGPGQFSTASSSFSCSVDEGLKEGFRTFPRVKRKCGVWRAGECRAGWARQLSHAERSSNGSCRSRRALELIFQHVRVVPVHTGTLNVHAGTFWADTRGSHRETHAQTHRHTQKTRTRRTHTDTRTENTQHAGPKQDKNNNFFGQKLMFF